jgi:hypothetical protein
VVVVRGVGVVSLCDGVASLHVVGWDGGGGMRCGGGR